MIIYYDNGAHPLLRTHFIRSGVHYTTIYRNKAAQLTDRISRHMFRPRSLMYNRPVCSEDDDKVICFDTYTNADYLRWICRHYPHKRIILWYWNPVEDIAKLDMMPRKVEIWSYSRKDCIRYGLKYNTTFYFDDLGRQALALPETTRAGRRVLFIGRDKGREEVLHRLQEELESAGAETEFHIMRNNEKKDTASGREHLMDYDEIVERVRNADILLDYSRDPDAGLSLRAMEALFWQKKLITNNRSVKDSMFYKTNNIYLLGEDKRTLRDFLELSQVPVEKEIKQQYLLSSWLKRFDEAGTQ